MYTSAFVVNSDYRVNKLLQQRVIKDDVDSRQIVYDLADDAIDTKNIRAEFPRISSQILNIGKFSLEQLLPMINNIQMSKRPVSVNRCELLHKNTKEDYIAYDATNYMIIGKPGIDTFKLAEKLEQLFRCIHIDCDQLIEREIKNKSRLGIWLNKNLDLNKILPIEIVLWLIQREIQTSKVKYCGYILTGLPIVPNTDLHMNSNCLTDEEFLTFQQIVDELIDAPITNRVRELAKLKKKLFSEYPHLEDDVDMVKEELVEQTESPEGLRALPKLFHPLRSDQDVRFSVNRQLFFTLELVHKPTILIYIDCDDQDIITYNSVIKNRTERDLDAIRIALKHYHNALDVVQQFICHFPFSNVVPCHGIFSLDEMFKTCSEKIKDCCCFRRVFIPIDFYETFKDDESIIEQLEATTDPDKRLDILCKINPIRNDLGWFKSNFNIKCPVMMSHGKCVNGKYQHSVLYTGIVYLLSSDENKHLFLENPQLFVHSFPTCRVGIMGTRCSGKSTFARCLTKFFENSTIVDVNYLFEHHKKIQIDKLYYAEACEYVLTNLNLKLLEKHDKDQQTLQKKINEWISVMKKKIAGFLQPIPKGKTKTKGAVKLDKKAAEENRRLKSELDAFGFETDDPVLLKTYLTTKTTEIFLNKLPIDLRKTLVIRESKIGDSDVNNLVAQHMNELSKDYVLPLVRKLEILVTKIRLCEKRQKILTKQNRLYGNWILDNLPPDMELINGLQEMDCLPDVIIYMDDSIGERLAENQNIKCHREFYDINYVMATIANTNKYFFKHILNEIRKSVLVNNKATKFFEGQVIRRELDHILMQDTLLGTIDFQDENENYRERFNQVKALLEPLDTYFIFVDIHNLSWTDALICGLKDYMNYFNAHPKVIQNDGIEEETGGPKEERELPKKEIETLKEESETLKEENESPQEDMFTSNIVLYGTTAEYCPVLFVDNKLLKLGLSQYSVQLQNRTYMFSTQGALETFVKNPFKYTNIERPFAIPPYRLCVIGNYKDSMQGDLKRVADILGTKFFSMKNIINLHLNRLEPKRNFNVTNFYEILDDLGDSLVNDIVAPLFNEGFLIENFPLTADHLEQMIKLNHFPEQIFYFKIENKQLMKVEVNYYINEYKIILLKKIDEFKMQNNDWMHQRRLRFEELFVELSDDVDIDEENENYADRLDPDTLADILNEFDVNPDSDEKFQLKQLYVADMVNEEMPPDRYTKLIDELMKFSMKQKVKDFIQSRTEEFEKIKSVAEEHLIPFIQIRLHPYTNKEIEKSMLKYIKESTDRQYIFDRAIPISFENAVDYIQHGQFLLSRYFWTCPVRNLDMNYPIKLSLKTPDLNKKLQPFIHQRHIYFVQRLYHNVDKFRARPYQYTSQINTCQVSKRMCLIIHGPRNGGSDFLCKRIQEEFQLKHFTLDGMKTYVVTHFKWTKIAAELIENNMIITDDQQICDLVKISVNFETQGWVLHNLPVNADLVKCFVRNSLDLHLIIYLDPTGMDLWTNFKNEYNVEQYKRKIELIQQFHGMITNLEEFSSHNTDFKGLNQNVITIKDFTSKWITWNQAYREIFLLLRLFNLYVLRAMQLTATSLYKLDVSDYELNFRLGPLRLYCPLCWLDDKLLIQYQYHYVDDEEAEPIYSNNLYFKNLFQFRKHFYWSCNKHLVELMVNAESYLPTLQLLPDELPKLVKQLQDYNITNQGYCPVAYLESDNTEIVIGLPEYSVLYFQKIYVMSCESYCLKFLQNPDKYKDIQIIFIYSQRSNEADEDFKNMKLDFGSITPTLITNALLECAFERPKHYSLDPNQSLEIYLGLYFKCHNSNSSHDKIDLYKSLFLKYWNECKLVQRNIYEMQMSGNPYILRKKKPKSAIRASSISAFGF